MSRPQPPTITGGTFRGRRLEVPPGHSVRPTRSLVRQALFNMLGDVVIDARVLDVYSGSGALGLEALSRGAERVLFVEQDRHALKALRHNIAGCDLAADRARVLAADVLAWVPAAGETFDLVLADPPFVRTSALPDTLEDPGVLAPGAWLAWHAPADRPAPELGGGWVTERSRTHGRSALHLFRRTS